MSSPTQPLGLINPWSTWAKFGQIDFVVRQILASVQTATLVKVVSCTNSGGLSPFGFVNVVNLVNQVDAAGNSQPHTMSSNLPYIRVQGGSNAIIIDPQPGDLGLVVFASRDISKVNATQAQADPGSARQYDYSDGLYIGGLLNAVPTQYVQFNSSGVTIVSPTAVIVKAPGVQLGDGGALVPLMSNNYLDFWKTEILPFLQGLGYTGPNPPSNSVTSVVQGQ